MDMKMQIKELVGVYYPSDLKAQEQNVGTTV
jgi:hypothetical protein